MKMWETGKDKKERSLLVTVDLQGENSWSVEDSAQELTRLARSSGVDVAREIVCHRQRVSPSYFIGRGKVEEIAHVSQQSDADVVIFNEDLSSTQQRNLEEIINVKTIDRTQLILDIFAQRAKSMEGKIQVELAQLEYLFPRLTGKGILLSRLGGGIGTRGPGEKKLEVDRRRMRQRIGRLRKELDNLSQRRNSLREYRRRHNLPTVSIIGYTNAGKSTLINRLSGAQQIVKNSLFSTLDSVARRFTLPNGQKVLFSDTVGFLHRLPHHLIEAFKATLEEVKQADILLHVLDISSSLVYEQNQAVWAVLKQLNIERKPMVVALNKLDLLKDEFVLRRYLKDFKNSVAVSSLKGKNLDQLLEKIMHMFSGLMADIEVLLPQEKMYLLNLIYQQGQVFKKEFRQDRLYLQARVPVKVKAQLENVLQKNI